MCVCVCVCVCVCSCWKIILKWFRELIFGGVSWIHWTQSMVWFRVLYDKREIYEFRKFFEKQRCSQLTKNDFVAWCYWTTVVTFVNTRAALRWMVTQNSVLRGMVRPEKVDVKCRWKNLCSVVLGDLYSSADNIVIMKQRRMKWMDRMSHVRKWATC